MEYPGALISCEREREREREKGQEKGWGGENEEKGEDEEKGLGQLYCSASALTGLVLPSGAGPTEENQARSPTLTVLYVAATATAFLLSAGLRIVPYPSAPLLPPAKNTKKSSCSYKYSSTSKQKASYQYPPPHELLCSLCKEILINNKEKLSQILW